MGQGKIENVGFRWLAVCASLAAGELTASRVSCAADAWPAVAVCAALAAIFGYGFRIRLWIHAVLFLLGMALFLHASVEKEQFLRGKPWMRGHMTRRFETSRRGRATDVPWLADTHKALSRNAGTGLARNPLSASLNRAILLGERRRLPPEIRNAFVQSGAMHVFAVSGVHVMAIAHVLAFLFRVLLFVPRRFAGAAAIPAIWAYVGVIGAPPSAVRAAAMASVCFLAPLFWRRPDAIVSWSLTFLTVACLTPTLIVDTGCALSFTVMLALLLAAESMRGRSATVSLPVMTLVAWAAGAPIAGRIFGHFTPGGLIANLALIPMAGSAVTCGALGMLAGLFSDCAASHLNNLAALITSAMTGISEAVASLPFSDLTVPRWSISACAAWYAALLAGLVLLRTTTARTWLRH